MVSQHPPKAVHITETWGLRKFLLPIRDVAHAQANGIGLSMA